MGRPIKYKTEAERKYAARQYQREYYLIRKKEWQRLRKQDALLKKLQIPVAGE